MYIRTSRILSRLEDREHFRRATRQRSGFGSRINIRLSSKRDFLPDRLYYGRECRGCTEYEADSTTAATTSLQRPRRPRVIRPFTDLCHSRISPTAPTTFRWLVERLRGCSMSRSVRVFHNEQPTNSISERGNNLRWSWFFSTIPRVQFQVFRISHGSRQRRFRVTSVSSVSSVGCRVILEPKLSIG